MMQSYMPPSGGRPGPTAARQTMNPGGQPLPQQANPMARQAMMAKALREMPGSQPPGVGLPTPVPQPQMPTAPTGPIADLGSPMPMPGQIPSPMPTSGPAGPTPPMGRGTSPFRGR